MGTRTMPWNQRARALRGPCLFPAKRIEIRTDVAHTEGAIPALRRTATAAASVAVPAAQSVAAQPAAAEEEEVNPKYKVRP